MSGQFQIEGPSTPVDVRKLYAEREQISTDLADAKQTLRGTVKKLREGKDRSEIINDIKQCLARTSSHSR